MSDLNQNPGQQNQNPGQQQGGGQKTRAVGARTPVRSEIVGSRLN
jgi:hypothetical protein